jgi:translation initiation factor IF-3
VDDHDYETKKNHALRFLEEGDKVKATIFFRGREMTRTGLGRELLQRLIKDIGNRAIVENMPRQEGNTLHAILAPPKTDKAKTGGGSGGQKQAPRAGGQQQQPPKQGGGGVAASAAPQQATGTAGPGSPNQ